MIFASSDTMYDVPYMSWDMAIISEMAPKIAAGSVKAQGSNVKPNDRVRAAQSN
jgi:hypothetical protein